MLRKMLITTTAIAAMCIASTAMAMPGGSSGAPAVISGGHASGPQFGHGVFGHPLHKRFHKTVVFPYGYYDNDYPTDTFGDDAPMTYSPPVVSAAPSPPPCQRNVETFTVPSSAGGTRQIKIINCP